MAPELAAISLFEAAIWLGTSMLKLSAAAIGILWESCCRIGDMRSMPIALRADFAISCFGNFRSKIYARRFLRYLF